MATEDDCAMNEDMKKALAEIVRLRADNERLREIAYDLNTGWVGVAKSKARDYFSAPEGATDVPRVNAVPAPGRDAGHRKGGDPTNSPAFGEGSSALVSEEISNG